MARGVAAALAVVLVSTLVPAGAASAKKRPVVPSELFGVHYHSVSSAPVNFRVGAIRLWDTGVSWTDLQPTPEAINWAPLDAAVANAEAGGAREIQYAFGHTPLWAAKYPDLPGPIGDGSSSVPARLDYFLDFARAVAERYEGRITSYDMWNEGSLRIYFKGTSKDLARMTIKGSRVIKRADPAAKVLAPSITYGVFDRRPKFWKDFAKRLKRAKWPIDAVNVHPYSKKPNYLKRRASIIRKTKRFYRKLGFKGPVWDTEVNYGDRRGLNDTWLQIVYTGEEAAGMLARTYVDSMRTGVRRVFWYGWDSHVLGIDTIDPVTGQITAAGVAFHTVQDWMVGKRWYGCKKRKKVRRCRLRGPDGARTSIIYATSKTRTFTIPKRVTAVQELDGELIPVERGQRIRVGAAPVLLVGA